MSLTAGAFFLLFAGACLLALVRHPIYGLLAYMAAFYLHPPSRWWGDALPEWRWSLLAAAVTAVAFIVRRPLPHTIPLRKHAVFGGLVVFVIWLALQSFWAIDGDAHQQFFSYYVKFAIAFVLIYKCVDSPENLRLFLWFHVLGCFYLGWLAFTNYSGGRFEEFGGPGLDEANAGAIQIVTGVLAGASLFLSGPRRERLLLIGIMPVIVNAIVTTISRGGFLAFGLGGVIFNLFTPPRFRKFVRWLSVLGVALFLALSNVDYWKRIETIKHVGADVEDIDTGSGRLLIIEAQWDMFLRHPLGCGHMCTTALSPRYLGEEHLSEGARASHNTFMSMLVDHGIVGALMYVLLLWWIFRTVRRLMQAYAGERAMLASVVPCVVAVLGAIFVADQFAQYPKFEARWWFLALLAVLASLSAGTPASQIVRRSGNLQQGRGAADENFSGRRMTQE